MAKFDLWKDTNFGHNRIFSSEQPTDFRPNLQRVTVFKDGRKFKMVLCAKCIGRSASPRKNHLFPKSQELAG
jgi:ribosomal protein L28